MFTGNNVSAAPRGRQAPQPHRPGAVQPKAAAPFPHARQPAAAPPAYVPHAAPRPQQPNLRPAAAPYVQPKAHAACNLLNRAGCGHTPAGARPATPQPPFAQRQAAGVHQPRTNGPHRPPAAPPVYRPGQQAGAQAAAPSAAARVPNAPKAPPVYRPEPLRGVQRKAVPVARPVAAGAGVLQRWALRGPSPHATGTHAFQGRVIQRHHNQPLDSTMEADAEIYIITTDMSASKAAKVDDNDVVYVGQTCAQVGLDTRFKQHLKVHLNWDDSTHQPLLREALKECTQLEVTAAERYWYDHYMGKGSPLENAIVPITKAKFLEYKTKKTFRGAEKNFPNGDNWKPAS